MPVDTSLETPRDDDAAKPVAGAQVQELQGHAAPAELNGAPDAAVQPVATAAASQELGSVMPWRLLARWTLVVLGVYCVGWMVWATRPALIPFGIGLVLAYLMAPGVNYFARWMPRWLAILLVYVLGSLGLVATFGLIIPPLIDQVERLIRNLPTFSEIQALLDAGIKQYRDHVPPSLQQPIERGLENSVVSLQNNIDTYLQRGGTFLLNQVLQLLNTVTFILGFISLPIWLFYVLHDQNQGRTFFDQLVHPRARADFWNVWDIFNQVLGSYIRGQIILCLAVGIAVGLGLLVLEMLGFPLGGYILVLALIAGVTEFIPVLGPTIGAIPGVVLGFAVSPGAGLAVLALYIAVQQLENSLLVPRIIGDSVGVHPALLTVVMIIMGTLFGLIGIILAAPTVATARDIFTYAYLRLEGYSAVESRERIAARHAPIVPTSGSGGAAA